MSKPTLLEQLALLSNPTPADLDPELAYSSLSSSKNAKLAGSDNGDDVEDMSGGRDHYLDVGASSLRKTADERDADLEDSAKYGGERRTRQQIFDDDNEDGDDQEDNEGADEEEEDEEDEEMDDGEAEEQEDQDEEDEGSEDDGLPTGGSSSTSKPNGQANLETTQILSSIRQSRSEDVAKGLGVKRQLEMFEKVMPLRIRLQKAVVGVEDINPDELRTQMANASPETKEMLDSCLAELRTFSEGLFELREGLLKLNDPTLTAPPSKRRKLSPSTSTDSTSYFAAAQADALALSDLTHPSLITNLHKWSSKILAAQGLSSLLPRDKFRAVRIGTVEQVAASLAGSEGQKKVARFLEGEGLDKLGKGDKEFYQSLVRDVIEREGSGGGLAATSAPALPNRLPKVRKATLDTRASKGRKLRFIPHEKMMNFMVPVPMEGVGGGWHEEQVDELFGSLLGKRVGDDDEEEASPAVGLGGLRVF